MPTNVTSPLQPYLPRLVLDWQQSTPDALVREIEGSMVFVDISGFTKMSERLARQGKVGAEEVSDVIGATFGILLAEAYACGGSLIKFGGDALLLFFQGHDHTVRAVAAAHGMRVELRRVGTFATTAGNVTLRMSVGAHTGLFHFFLVGGSHRELVVAGPAATETVTMEGAASAGQILLSPALAAALPAANRGRHVGPGVLLAGRPPAVERSDPSSETAAFDLEPFVPTALRETVLAGEVEPEHRSVTIAFVHYGGFDDLVRREGPDAAAVALDTLVRSAQRAVDAHDVAFLATDVAPDGGKIILTAGAPVVTGADEEQMLLALREIGAGDSGLPLHVGVNRGPVFAGAIGPPYRRTYTVMGDAVNLAARLMAKAGTGEIVATPDVLDASRTIFDTTELEPFFVKGKKEAITALTVGEAQGSRASVARAGLPLLGRDAELQTLFAAWESAQDETGRVAELTAEPGMGKSRLLQEFLERAEGQNVIRSECRLYQSATPYFPFRAFLRSAFGLDGPDDEADIVALGRLVDERSPELRPWLSLIATPLDLAVEPSPEVQALEDEFRRTRLEEAVATLVAAVASEPTVAVVEDTHWMDEPSRELLARVTAALRERPWFVILTRRPGQDGYVAADEGDTLVRLELQPLDAEAATELIYAATDDAPPTAQQVRELADRAAGNPLFLIELLDALRRGENVETMPGSVEGLIHARIDRLPTIDRRRLRALAVLGLGFQIENAGVALDGSEPRQVTTILRGLGDFLSVDHAGWVQFRHALIRDAAYEGLPYRRRLELHARIGDSILAAAEDVPEDAAELLSLHYSYARRWPEAWAYSRVAGDRAREVYANMEAARFYQRALTASARLETVSEKEVADVWRSLGVVSEATGEFDRADQALRRAGRLLRSDPVAQAEICEKRAVVQKRVAAYPRALRATASGLKLVEGLHSREACEVRASLSAYRADIRLQQGHVREAVLLARAAAGDAERHGARRALAHAYRVLHSGYQQLGEPENAVYEELALEIWRELGELRIAAIIEMNLGVNAYAEGRWDEAVRRYTRAQEDLQRVGDPAHAGLAGANLGELLVSQGALDEAEPVLVEARRALRAAHFADAAIFADMQFARLLLARRRPAEAVEMLQRAVDEAGSLGHPKLVEVVAIQLGEALVRAAEPERALAVLDGAERGAGDEAMDLKVPLGLARAGALMALGRSDEAARDLATALALARRQGLLYEETLILEARAELARRTGGAADEEELREARRLRQLLAVTSSS